MKYLMDSIKNGDKAVRSFRDLIERKYFSEDSDWKVLIKILNSYKSPIFYVYTHYQ